MPIISYKVVSYLKSTGGQPYILGYYATDEQATAKAADYNTLYEKTMGGLLIARAEPVYC